jgi:hypothetical protein
VKFGDVTQFHGNELPAIVHVPEPMATVVLGDIKTLAELLVFDRVKE